MSPIRRFGTDRFSLPISTPGPLGHQDAASPDSPEWVIGETPGPLGFNDYADPSYRFRIEDGNSCRLTDKVPVPQHINRGLTAPSPDFLVLLLGKPRELYSNECERVTNPILASQMLVSQVGPFKVHGLRPAIESLKMILNEIRQEHPNVYASLGSSGMLCCRKQRGSPRISSHSWGTAIDINIKGALDERGDGRVQYGLTLIAPFFNRYGWVWGAAFRKEDGMHFEASKSKLLQWEAEGKIHSQRT
ncbi:D-alanyl-D-alanine carboxypeptidase-related domain protein [Citrifermentans bemidjiense Bem]|uniref:D-alanyl-D-alanine carboxypeptidase-related domain protein n=1 Tax=Citrifermentans bemidjiense (strain ATCC BAA-1014 / DSM 16622 / JCM 12645 / Bem) TaxID=404380 RepID=B5EHY6_CITBB|nr:M15 family metallopeptidase [Citrifermentans bemidjiense]ACH39785.1 D-alanyl-D-alanine carboxypeptidase-related domain protein [Citrifermentans bemidjiense Bem]